MVLLRLLLELLRDFCQELSLPLGHPFITYDLALHSLPVPEQSLVIFGERCWLVLSLCLCTLSWDCSHASVQLRVEGVQFNQGLSYSLNQPSSSF